MKLSQHRTESVVQLSRAFEFDRQIAPVMLLAALARSPRAQADRHTQCEQERDEQPELLVDLCLCGDSAPIPESHRGDGVHAPWVIKGHEPAPPGQLMLDFAA